MVFRHDTHFGQLETKPGNILLHCHEQTTFGLELSVCIMFAGTHVTGPCTPFCPPFGNANISMKGICSENVETLGGIGSKLKLLLIALSGGTSLHNLT